MVSRLNGQPFALNPDLIERADATPDTVVTLTNGAKYVVAEGLEELVAAVRDYRASIVALAHQLEAGVAPVRALHVVPNPSGES
jgi:flagellar protein FlbD